MLRRQNKSSPEHRLREKAWGTRSSLRRQTKSWAARTLSHKMCIHSVVRYEISPWKCNTFQSIGMSRSSIFVRSGEKECSTPAVAMQYYAKPWCVTMHAQQHVRGLGRRLVGDKTGTQERSLSMLTQPYVTAATDITPRNLPAQATCVAISRGHGHPCYCAMTCDCRGSRAQAMAREKGCAA